MIRLLLALLGAQQGADTTLTVRGILAVMADGSQAEPRWVLALPNPLSFRGQLISSAQVSGKDSRRWSKLDRAYVEVSGSLALASVGDPALTATSVREVTPEGLVRREVATSFSQRIVSSLYVMPRTFRWRDEAGQSTGVAPVMVFSLNNHGQAKLTLDFTSADYVCFTVSSQHSDRKLWVGAIPFNREPDMDYRLTLPIFIREMLLLPEHDVAGPGKFRVRAGLCGYPEYQAETDFEIVG